ncbi:MAG: hypothetical protein MUF33_09765, partial [Candidatus Nanopelagicales bacterium]|nr:hypothetical protein [Candidatus Nanopelagicales bacterium]
MARSVDLDVLVAGARAGDPRSVGRLITLVEDGAPQLRALMAALAQLVGESGDRRATEGRARDAQAGDDAAAPGTPATD